VQLDVQLFFLRMLLRLELATKYESSKGGAIPECAFMGRVHRNRSNLFQSVGFKGSKEVWLINWSRTRSHCTSRNLSLPLRSPLPVHLEVEGRGNRPWSSFLAGWCFSLPFTSLVRKVRFSLATSSASIYGHSSP